VKQSLANLASHLVTALLKSKETSKNCGVFFVHVQFLVIIGSNFSENMLE